MATVTEGSQSLRLKLIASRVSNNCNGFPFSPSLPLFSALSLPLTVHFLATVFATHDRRLAKLSVYYRPPSEKKPIIWRFASLADGPPTVPSTSFLPPSLSWFFYLVENAFWLAVLLQLGRFFRFFFPGNRAVDGTVDRFVISRPRLKSFTRPTVKRDIRGIIRCLSCFLPSNTESEVSAPRSKEFPVLSLLALVLIYRWIIVDRDIV